MPRPVQTARLEIIDTPWGGVEIVLSGGRGDVVLVFPGGHCSAATPVGVDLYTQLGYRALVFSRPGYGRTTVGDLTAAEFVPAVAYVVERLELPIAATVGISFGGLQALHVAVGAPSLAPRLILHSCAPSTLAYPDTKVERVLGPLLFSPSVQPLVWRTVRALTCTEKGLRAMMSTLSTLPSDTWWDQWSGTARAEALATFAAMNSGSGFVNDLRQATPRRSPYRQHLIASVPCPTLITASRWDGAIDFAHARKFADTIPDARLVETDAVSHFYWIGPSRQRVADAISAFLPGSRNSPGT